MLVWDGPVLSVGGARFRTISEAEFAAAIADIDAARRVFVDAVPDAGPPPMLIWKSPLLIEQLAELVARIEPRRIFELGVAQGGSTALLAALAPQAKIVAVEIAADTGGLGAHVEREGLGERVRPYFGVDQSDRGTLERILADEFAGEPIDLVIDDASHQLDLSRTSFEILFPRVRPGGCYVVEDWRTGDLDRTEIGDASVLPEGPPLTGLIVELLLAVGAPAGVIDRVDADPTSARVWRGSAPLDVRDWTVPRSDPAR